MSNKNSIYVGALTSFILDTKPYHSKLTEIQEIYQFFDTMNVRIDERLFSSVLTKAAWPYSYFSDGVAELTPGVGKPMSFHQLVSPLSRGYDRNSKPLESRGAFKAFRDENKDLPLVPFAFDPKCLQGVGLADAFVQRDGLKTTNEALLEGHDVFLSKGAYVFQIKQTLSMQPLVVGRFTDVYEVADGPFPLFITLPFSTADSLVIIGPATQVTLNSISVTGPGRVTVTGISSDPNYDAEFTERKNENLLAWVTQQTQALALDTTNPLSAVKRIEGILNAIGAQLSLTPNPAASVALAALQTIVATPALPDSYEALLNALVVGNTPVISGHVGWIGQDVTTPYTDKYVDQVLSALSPGLYFNAYTDLSQRENGSLYYLPVTDGLLSITNIVANPIRPQYEEYTLTATNANTLVITGSSSGPIGTVVAGTAFNSTRLAFNTSTTGALTVGAQYKLSPAAKVTVHYQAPLEAWSLIQTNPLAYSRPSFLSTRYGYVRDTVGIPNFVTVLDPGIPTGTSTLTATSTNTFKLESSDGAYFVASIPVNVPFNDGRLAFTIVQGSAYTFTVGDKFFIELLNQAPMAEDLDLFYGYDLDGFDADTVVYNNISSALSNYLEQIGFGYDSRFLGHDLSSFGLVLAPAAVDDVQWRLRALPDISQPLNLQLSVPTNQLSVIVTNDPLNPLAVVQFDMLNDITNEGPQSSNDPDLVADLRLFYSTSFELEYYNDTTNTWVSVGTVPVGVPYTNSTHGLSFTIVPADKPFISGQLISSQYDVVSGPVNSYTTIGGDVISWTVRNEPPIQSEPASLSSRLTPRLIMRGESFFDTTPARWVLNWVSNSAYQLQGNYVGGPQNGLPVFSSPLSISTDDGHSFRNDEHHLHWTIVPGIAGLAPNDSFTFETYARQPSFMVCGSVSGWQPDAVIGDWYWNGKIGFKLPRATASVFSGTMQLAGETSWTTADGPITLDRLRPDAPSATYLVKSLAPGHWTLYRAGELVGDGDSVVADKYLQLTMPLTAVGIEFVVKVEGITHDLTMGHDLAILRAPAGRMPSSDDFVLLERTEQDSLQLSIKAKDAGHQTLLNGLAPAVTDLRFVDHNANSGVPLSSTSPETAVMTGWLPVLRTFFDKPLSLAEFSDAATHVVVRAAATGEKVGTVESLSNDPAYPVVFRWDPAFHDKYLPLNSEATVVSLGSGMDDRLNVNMRDSAVFLISGGGLADDMLFADAMTVKMEEDSQWAIRSTYDEIVNAAIADGPFGGFLPGYDNTRFDFETNTGDVNDENSPDGYYDAGIPTTDDFMNAQALALLPSMTPPQQALFNELSSKLAPYLDGDVITTTLAEFIVNVNAAAPVNYTPTSLGFGIPAIGMGMSITQSILDPEVPGVVQTCEYEMYAGGMAGYTTISGNASLFTVSAGVLTIAAQNSATAAVRRRVFTTPVTLGQASFRGRLNTLNADDGPAITWTNVGATGGFFSMNLAREAFFDAQRRPRLSWRTNTANPYVEYIVYPTQLVVGRWYQFDLGVVGANFVMTVTDTVTNATVTTILPGWTAPGPLIGAMQFSADASGLTSSGSYSDISICTLPSAGPPNGPNTALTQIVEAMTVLAVDAGYALNQTGYDIGQLDENSESTAILFSVTGAPIPSAGLPPVGTSYNSFSTPLVVNAPGARVIELSFASAILTTPSFYLWRPTDAAPSIIPVVQRLSPRLFRFTVPSASELKLIIV